MQNSNIWIFIFSIGLLVSCTTTQKSVKLEKNTEISTPQAKIKELIISSDKIKENENIVVYWEVETEDQVEISLHNIASKLPLTGSKILSLKESSNILLTVEKDNLILDSISKYVEIIKNNKIVYTYDSVSKGADDGRFTIGAGDKRMMFGYPIPHSTSHFVLNVGGKLCSNSPHFQDYYQNNSITYISSNRKYIGTTASLKSVISFFFNGVEIRQTLIPVDEDLFELPENSWARYYKIEYTIINHRQDDVEIGLISLVDTMIDENDEARMKSDNMEIQSSKCFTKANIPNSIYVYRNEFDDDDFLAEMRFRKNMNTYPDRLYIGNWPYLHSVAWEFDFNENYPYYDSAILLKWDLRKLAVEDSSEFSYFYGFPKEDNVRMLLNTPTNTDIEQIFFDIGSTVLSQTSKQLIDELIDNKEVFGVIVEGFGDAVGSDKTNLKISEMRAVNTRKYLASKGIPSEFIIVKAYGERYADQSTDYQRIGKSSDRKCIIYLLTEIR